MTTVDNATARYRRYATICSVLPGDLAGRIDRILFGKCVQPTAGSRCII
jgi:hypothetical protein